MSYNGLDSTEQKIPDEFNPRIIGNTLLYPIAKSFFEQHFPSDDIIKTYDRALEDTKYIIRDENIVSEYIPMGNNITIKFMLYFDNFRIYSPNQSEARQYSVQGYNPYPARAFASKGTYSACCVSDTVYKCYSYTVVNGQIDTTSEKLVFEEVIPDSYYFNFPIPIMSKYCSLRKFDDQTLIQTGEERELAGFFIIEGFVRYIINIDRKPLNHEIIQRNLYDNQLSRCDVIYTKGFDYEKSYNVVASMVRPKQAHAGRAGKTYSPPDFIFSLLLNDKAMNIDANFNRRAHSLINAVPMKFMFVAFGCKNDEEILRYVCPSMDNFSLMQAVRNACLNGFAHMEALELASVKTKLIKEQIIIDEPLTQFLAFYIIGSIILSPKFRQSVMDNCKQVIAAQGIKGDAEQIALREEYRRRIALKTREILKERFMPGVGMYNENDSGFSHNHAICIELGFIVRKLYMVGNRFEESQEKASMVNKRIRAGQQIEREFLSFHGVRLREIMEEVRKIFSTSANLSTAKTMLGNKLRNVVINAGKAMSMSLLNSFKQTSREQSKLRTELLTYKNNLFMDNVLREIVKTPSTQMKGSDVTWEHRQAHLSELYFIDPVMTPEAGKQVGRFKSPTVYTSLTISSDGKQEAKYITSMKTFVRDIYDKNGNVAINPSDLYNIKLNGSIIGYVHKYNDVDEMYRKLMEARRTNEIHRDCSVILNHNGTLLSIWTDTGRIVSPFVKIANCFEINPVNGKDGKDNKLEYKINLKPDFLDWLNKCSTEINQYEIGLDKGFIELADPEMVINNFVIAGSIRDFFAKPNVYTHIALPLAVYSTVTAVTPAINLNKSVRGSLITNHVKQMIGPTMRYPQIKFKDEQHFTIAPQIPICRPCIYDYRHQGERPYGQTIIIACMYYKYNQEDSVILNKASVESGMLEIDTTMTFTSEINRDEEFKVPANTVLHGNPESYQKLDGITCLPKRVSEKFRQKDALIAKVIKTPYGISDGTTINEQPDSRYMHTPDKRLLRSVLKMKQQDENKILKMSVFGQYQPLIVGDKTNFETAQKDTVGKILSPGDMPYTASGIKPDVIFNPISIFKRVTCAQEYMPFLCKIATLMGCPIDTTPFHTQRSSEELCELMKKIGLHETGEEIMYDPDTGRQYPAKIFIGTIYMGRQPHMVERKMNIRNGGPRSIDTYQPSKGRKRGGGQSVDRMGNDSLFAAGINLVSRDAHLARGSSTTIGVCNKCHCIKCYYHDSRKCWICPICGAHEDIIVKELPVASPMITHILNAMHLNIEYFPNGNINNDYDRLNEEITEQNNTEKELSEDGNNEDNINTKARISPLANEV